MKWHHCENCSQVQRFGNTCASCKEDLRELEVPRDQLQMALPLAGVPLLFIGIVGFLAREFAYEVVGDSGVCCTVVAVLYCLLVITILGMSIVGHLKGKQRALAQAEEEEMQEMESRSVREEYYGYRDEPHGSSGRKRGRDSDGYPIYDRDEEPVYEAREVERREGSRDRRRSDRRREYDRPGRRSRGRRGGGGRRRSFDDDGDDFEQLDDWLR